MRDSLNFESSQSLKVTNENIKGILLHFQPIKTDGSVADIVDLNKISIDIVLKRSYTTPFTIYSGYLDTLLSALYAQTPRMALAKKKRANGYLIELDLGGVSIELMADDELEIRVNAATTAFSTINKGLSSIDVETLISDEDPTPIPQIRAYNITAGKINFDEDLGNNISKIVFIQDFANAYIDSAKTKISSCSVTALQETEGHDVSNKPFTKDLSENGYLVENINYLDMNPESDVQDLVIYQSMNLLDNVKVKGLLTAAADNDTQFAVLTWQLV